MLGILFVLCSLVAAVVPAPAPEPTQSYPQSSSAGLRLPILVDRSVLHPRNKNLQGDALLQWMRKNRQAVHNKYNRNQGKKNHSVHRRQASPLGGVELGGFYFTQIGVGTPQKTFSVVLDTGSADFWLAGSQCSGCDGMSLYSTSKSSSYKGSQNGFEVPYGQGGVEGYLAADNVSLAGYQIEGLNFGIATRLAEGTIQAPASGIMGMGFESLSSSGATPFWQVASIQGKLKDPVFSFELTDINDASSAGKVTAGGVFTLGDLDDQQYSGEITWVDVASQYGSQGIGYWGIKMDSLTVNGKSVSLGGTNLVAVDTGTTLIGAPESIVRQIYAQIPNSQAASSSSYGTQGYYTFPCSQTFSVTFTFGGKGFTLNQDDLNIGQLETGSKMCGGAIFVVDVPSGSTTPGWILGDTFLSKYYSVYSWQPQRVGFASLPNSGPKTLALTSASQVASGATSAGASEGGGGISELSSHAQTAETGVVGASGLPTPSLVSVPSGMYTLSGASALPTGHSAEISSDGSVSRITVYNSAEWDSLTSQYGSGNGGGFFSILGSAPAQHAPATWLTIFLTLIAMSIVGTLL